MVRRQILLALVAVSSIAAACGARDRSPAASGRPVSQAPSGANPSASVASPSSETGVAPGLRVVGVEVTADPAELTGVCPIKITFNGRITVAGGAGAVSFTWVSSDGDVSPVKTIAFKGPGSMDVTSDWTVGTADGPKGSGWSSIVITDPAGAAAEVRSSQHADFSFTCDDSGFETIGFGLGGSDADCSIATPGSTFTTTDPIRVVADYSPPLQSGTIVTFTLTRNGDTVDGYPRRITLKERTKCLHGSVSPGVLPVGHYRLDIVPDTSRPIAGEFDTK